MDLSNYKVSEIRYAHSKFKLGQPSTINDEGLFYRIDSTHIFDKAKIKSIELNDGQLTLHMKDQDITLTIWERK